AVATAATATTEAKARVGTARQQLEEAARHDHAAAAAAGLAAGDPCPVCGRDLVESPSVSTADVDAVRQALAVAEQEADTLEHAHQAAKERLASAQARLEALQGQQQVLAARITSRTAQLQA